MNAFWRNFPASRPRKVAGGVKSRTKRGDFGRNWWTRRWLDLLEEFRLGARLTRARSYARNGQVLDIAVDKGLVTAKVQGSRSRPYAVKVKIRPLMPREWTKLARAVAGQAAFAAELLAGRLPEGIEGILAAAGTPLFPRQSDLSGDCSCPDWSNPCKHIAAVYCLLAEEIDRDPFLLFTLRGTTREEFLDLLDRESSGAEPGPSAAEPAAAEAPDPLPLDNEAFWNPGREAPGLGEVRVPETAAPLLRRLGPLRFWRGREDMVTALEPLYCSAAVRGLELLVGAGERHGDQSGPE